MGIKLADSLEPMTSGFPAAYGDKIWLDKNKGIGVANYGNLQTMFNNGELAGGGDTIKVVSAIPQSPTAGDVILYQGIWVDDFIPNNTYRYGVTVYHAYTDSNTNKTIYFTESSTEDISVESKIYTYNSSTNKFDEVHNYNIYEIEYEEGDYVSCYDMDDEDRPYTFQRDSESDVTFGDWVNITVIKTYEYIHEYVDDGLDSDTFKTFIRSIDDEIFIIRFLDMRDDETHIFYGTKGIWYPPGDHVFPKWTLIEGLIIYTYRGLGDSDTNYEIQFDKYELINEDGDPNFKFTTHPDDISSYKLGSYAVLYADSITGWMPGGLYTNQEAWLFDENYGYYLDNPNITTDLNVFNHCGQVIGTVTDVDNNTFTVTFDNTTETTYQESDISEDPVIIPLYEGKQVILGYNLPYGEDFSVGTKFRYTGSLNYQEQTLDVIYNHTYEIQLDGSNNKIWVDITPMDSRVEEALSVTSTAVAMATENTEALSDLSEEVSSLSEDISSLAGIKYPSVRNELQRWIPKAWSGLTDFNGGYIWTDGDNIYYSYGTDQYVLNKSTSTWSTKTWVGLTDFESQDVWTDGDNIYYSYGTNHYVLNKETSTWSTKTWNGLSGIRFEGRRVWTDGVTIYYSSASDQFVLDKSTSTWSTKTWSGLDIYGDMIVTDGYHIMQYDDDASMYILNPQTSTWSMANCNVAGYAKSFWTDGEHLYFSNPGVGDQLVFGGFSYDSSNNLYAIWGPVNWIGCDVDGQYIWTDGDNIYYSYGTDHYVLTKLKTSINAKPMLS